MDKKDLIATILVDRMRRGGYDGSVHLPTVRELALDLGVSARTVLAALRILENKGCLARAPGKKRYRQTGRYHGWDRLDPEQPLTDRCGRLAAALTTDLQHGRYTQMGLPSLKVLTGEHHCHHRTLRKALDILVERGMLLANGSGRARRFTLPARGRAGGARSRVYLVGTAKSAFVHRQDQNALVSALETELERLGWDALQFFTSAAPEGSPDAPPEDRVSAYLHVAFGRHQPWLDYLIARPTLPVVVLDMGEQFHRHLGTHNRYCILRPDNRRAGREVSTCLRELGHRRIAFVTPIAPMTSGDHPDYRPPDWVRFRFEGLQEAFDGLDDGTSVVVCQANQDADSGSAVDLFRPASLQACYAAAKATGYLPGAYLKQSFAAAFAAVDLCVTGRRMRPAFESALASGSTAWVCANDDIALLAWAFLKEKGLEIPEHLSLAGFDNSPAAARLGIASFDFRYDRMGHAAIRWLVAPDEFRLDRRRSYRITGNWVSRDSVGPNRGPATS